MSEHIEVSNMSILPLACAGVTTLTVNVLFDAATEPGGTDYGIGVYIDGAWSTSLVPTVDGIAPFTVALGGGSHNVDLWSSCSTKHLGAFVYSYSVDTGTATPRVLSPPTRRMVIVTDSIGCGALASPATHFAYGARARSVYPGRISWIGTGGMSLWDCANLGGVSIGLSTMAQLAARCVTYVQQDSPATREVWLALGTNDATYGNLGRQSAANFGTMYASLLTAINALDSSIRVYAVTPLISGMEAFVNAFGDSLPAYRTAIATAASGKAWVTLVVGPNLMTGGGISADSLHPTTLGHQAVFDGTGGFGGATNLRAVLGI